VTTIILYLPILLNPSIYLERGNDLQEFFWPIYYFVKRQLLTNHQLPFWNNMFLSGTPLLPDPQAPLYYPPNLIFLILPLGAAFILSSVFHTLIGGIGAYFVAKNGLKFSEKASLLAGVFYILSPRWSGFLEAGHFGIIMAYAWIPFVLLSTIQIAKKPNFKWIVLLSVSLAGLFYTHPTTFVLSAGLSALAFISILLFTQSRKSWIKKSLYFGLGAIFSFGLISISLLPQLEWIPETNRALLSTDRQVWPQWSSKVELIKSATIPLNYGSDFSNSLDSEKWLAIGLIMLMLSSIGVYKLYIKNKKLSLILTATVLAILVFAANNLSPFYDFFLEQNWYIFARVSTRSWFVISLIVIFLAAYTVDKTKKSKQLINIIIALAIIELLLLNWSRITKPIINDRQIATKSVIEYIRKDDGLYRVFCTTRCFSQQDVAKYELETIGGYSTLHQRNYYSQAWQLTGAYWNYYTIALPPIGAYKFGTLDPDYKSLGRYNTKYIVSPYEITNDALEYKTEIDNFYIYTNKQYLPRAYFLDSEIVEAVEIIKYTPNSIVIDTSNTQSTKLIVSEVYNNNWVAYLNKSEKVGINQTPNALRAIDIKLDTKLVELRYKSKFHSTGKLITVVTLVTIFVSLFLRKKNASARGQS